MADIPAHPENGFFITLEGPEGGGKTLLAQRLHNALSEAGYEVFPTREPGGTPLGDRIRNLLVDFSDQPPCPKAEALLFQASRAQLVEKVLRPHLATGGIALCDRYMDSTLAYQGYGYGYDLDWLRALVVYATGGLTPNLTFLLDLDVEIGLQRRQKSGELNRIDSKELDYHRRVRQGYLELSKLDPARWVIIDAERSPDEVFAEVLQVTLERIQATAGEVCEE